MAKMAEWCGAESVILNPRRLNENEENAVKKTAAEQAVRTDNGRATAGCEG